MFSPNFSGHVGSGHLSEPLSLAELSSVHGFFSRSNDRVIRLTPGAGRDRRSSRNANPIATPARTSPAIQMLL
jgi:hypothetical protein